MYYIFIKQQTPSLLNTPTLSPPSFYMYCNYYVQLSVISKD